MATLSQSNENCKNPWKEQCKSNDIELYIFYKNQSIPICRNCWSNISESDIEW